MHYLQTILIHPGETETFIGKTPVPSESLPWLFKKRTDTHGLGERQVILSTYKLENLTRLAILGEEVTAEKEKLGVRF